jgi:flagellar biosynthesis chaperone FliJ
VDNFFNTNENTNTFLKGGIDLSEVKTMKKAIKGNTAIIGMLAVIVFGYAFFFLSPRIFLPSEDSLLYTNLRTPVVINSDHSVTIENWIYSQKEKQMQIILSFDNTAIDASEEYIFQAVSRNVVKESKEVEYEVTYQSSSFVNVMLYNIPDDFNELALNVGYVADDDILIDESAKKGENKNAAYTTVYTNKYKVENADKIEPLSVVEMYINKLNDEIDGYESNIENLTQKISDAEESQKEILTKVDQLNKDKEYMTVNEVKKIDEQISAYETSYKSYTDKISGYEESIDEKNDDISTAKAKIKELENIIKEKGSSK